MLSIGAWQEQRRHDAASKLPEAKSSMQQINERTPADAISRSAVLLAGAALNNN